MRAPTASRTAWTPLIPGRPAVGRDRVEDPVGHGRHHRGCERRDARVVDGGVGELVEPLVQGEDRRIRGHRAERPPATAGRCPQAPLRLREQPDLVVVPDGPGGDPDQRGDLSDPHALQQKPCRCVKVKRGAGRG
ncbi:hypothetical protein OHB36_14685 [Streptomyces sp. NBC_00320]|nr:hypothetical protein [Streptomyces sp. NBC_00320]MCX5148002.1 hypothetical protein [Streptomyces sp. NBC_00320]